MDKKTTKDALALIASGKSRYEAAKICGLAYSTVFNAAKRANKQKADGVVRCPCCAQVVRDGFQINEDVLRTGDGKFPLTQEQAVEAQAETIAVLNTSIRKMLDSL